MILTYEQTKELLTSQGKFYIHLGLERVQAVLNILDNPQNKLKIIHIAGTNGKGSVSAILSNILKCSGYKIGLYTSPHLVEYTERIKINNKEITQSDFSKYIGEICEIADKDNIHLTEFEILTICAFKYFYDNKIDIAVIETGLGGRYDATNVCQNTILSIITSISLDHTDRLGNTYEKIALEKSGIIKNNSTVITSKYNNGLKELKKTSVNNNAQLIEVKSGSDILYINKKNYAVIKGKKYEFPLLGLYQKKNLPLVIEALIFLKKIGYKITEEALTDGLKTVKWSARLEFIKENNLIIDGAHNPDAAYELRKSLDFYFPGEKRIFIYSTLNTKNYKEIARILFTKEDEIHFYEFNNKNAVTYQEYVKEIPFLNNIKQFAPDNLYDILQNGGLKIITGSLYMIGSLYPQIKENILRNTTEDKSLK